MQYDLTDLRLFAAIAEEANLTRGAARAHLAASSASHRLAKLEESLGVALFERHARGLRPTRAGEALLGHARQVFAQLEQMHADLSPFARGVRAQVSGRTSRASPSPPRGAGGRSPAMPLACWSNVAPIRP